MSRPLDVATEGYLNSPLSVAASGYLRLGIVIFVDTTGSGAARSVEFTGKMTAAKLAQLRREDEEVVAIITAIGEHLL